MLDRALPFGARYSPNVFTRLTQAVRRMMERRGYKLVVFLDDFCIVSDTKDKCQEGLATLIALLRLLGFSIAWDKVISPTQKLVFLGIEIDSVHMTLSLPQQKVQNLKALLACFNARTRASCKQLQQLIGKLSWAASVVHGGRIYLQRCLDLLRPLKQQHHKARLSPEFHADILWWQQCLDTFNTRHIIPPAFPEVHIFTDACNTGAGLVARHDWAYIDWVLDCPLMTKEHINVKETMAIIYAVCRWAPSWCNRNVIIHTDNIYARACIK